MHPAKGCGGCLILLGIAFFLLAVFMFADPLEGETRLQSLIPGLFFGSVTLPTGVVIFTWGMFRSRRLAFEEQVTGFLRNHDRFTVEEMARKIGRTELQTEALISRLSVQHRLDLVFHRTTREYLHRARLGGNQRVVEQCPSCGARNQPQVVFGDEVVSCTYCNAPLNGSS